MNQNQDCTCGYDAEAVGEHVRSCPLGGFSVTGTNRVNLNPSDERLREIIVEKDAEIASLRKSNETAQDTVQRQGETIQLLQRDAERYRKLKPHIEETRGVHYIARKEKLCVMRKWWVGLVAEIEDSRSFDEIIDALPEAK